MKNIAILAIAEKKNGGTYQYTLKIIESFTNNENFKITIFTDVKNNCYDKIDCKIKKFNLSKYYWPLFLFLFFFKIKIKKLFIEQDLIIAPAYSPILLLTKIPFIFTLHDLQERYYPNFFTKSTIAWRSFIYNLLIKKSHKIICESEYVKNDILKFYKHSENKVYVIPAPPLKLKYDVKELNNHYILEKYNLKKKCYLIYPANFWNHKNHMNLILAFKLILERIPNLKLVLTGKKRFQYDNIYNNVLDLKIEKSIVFTDYISDKDLLILIKNSVTLVMPTLFESISIPIFEAFQLGTPVCVSNITSLPDQVGNAGVLFDPNSINDIYKKIYSLITNNELLDQLSINGYLRIENFSDIKFMQQLNILLK